MRPHSILLYPQIPAFHTYKLFEVKGRAIVQNICKRVAALTFLLEAFSVISKWFWVTMCKVLGHYQHRKYGLFHILK